jgi:phosphoglycerate-specific signal transduction histidine kinase
LVELHELYESQQTALSSIEEQVEEQERYLAGFEEWRRLAGRAVDLDERVLQFSERSGEDEFQERLDRLFTEINEQFSDHGKELLLNAGTYDDDIKKLQEEFDERVGQKRKAFEGEKERLESLLSTANGSHPGLRVQFSEADPDESYNHLETRFSEAFTDDVLSSLQETIRDIQRTVSRSKRFQTIPHDVDVDELTLSLETVDNELQDAKDTLDEWSLESDNETDAQLAKSVAETRGKIDELEDEVEALNRPVRPESEPLQQLYEELEYGSHIQLDDILETQGNDTEDPEEIAKKLAKLFKSNLLDIQVYKRFRDLPEE